MGYHITCCQVVVYYIKMDAIFEAYYSVKCVKMATCRLCVPCHKFLDTMETYLCIKAMRSAALPDPSHTTTGTGGLSVTYSRTARIVLVPPSITRQTTGVLLCVSRIIKSLILSHKFIHIMAFT